MRKLRVNDHAMAPLMRQMLDHPILSRAEEQALARAVQQRSDAQAMQTLVQANLRFVVKIAHQYRGYELPLADLLQEGSVGLMMAVRKFDPARGFRLISYAVWWVRAYMQNYIMHNWSMVKMGTTQAQRKLFFKLRQARERLLQLYPDGGADLVADIADSLHVRPDEVYAMQGRLCGRDASLQAPVAEAQAQHTRQDLLVDEGSGANPEEVLLLRQQQHYVRQQVAVAMQQLNAKERYILQNRVMSQEPETLQQVGRFFSISRERARQIEGNVLRKMRGVLRHMGAMAPYAGLPAPA